MKNGRTKFDSKQLSEVTDLVQLAEFSFSARNCASERREEEPTLCMKQNRKG
jgi:hypothetical protein